MTPTSDKLSKSQFIIPAIPVKCCITCNYLKINDNRFLCKHNGVYLNKTQLGGKCDNWNKLKGV